MLIPRTVLSTMTACCDGGSTRYALGGVFIRRPRPNGKPFPDPIAVSTDGRAMLIATWPEENPAEYPGGAPADFNSKPVPGTDFLLPEAACKRLAKLADPGKRCFKPILQNVLVEELPPQDPKTPTSRCIRAFATDLESGACVTERELEGRFPKWQDCIPTYDQKNSVSIDVDFRYLADVMKAVSNCADNDTNYVRLSFRLENLADGKSISNHAIAISALGHSRKALGIVMPVGGAAPSNEGPYWIPERETDIPAAVAALPDEFTADFDTVEGLERVLAYSELPPAGYVMRRNSDETWTATGPEKESLCWAYDKAGILTGKNLPKAGQYCKACDTELTDGACPRCLAEVLGEIDDKVDKPESEDLDDELSSYKASGPFGNEYFDPQAFMEKYYGEEDEDGQRYVVLDDSADLDAIFAACPVRDREALAEWLMEWYEEQHDRQLDVEEAYERALPVGPEPNAV